MKDAKISLKNLPKELFPHKQTREEHIYLYLKKHPRSPTGKIATDTGIRNVSGNLSTILKELTDRGIVNHEACSCGNSKLWSIKK